MENKVIPIVVETQTKRKYVKKHTCPYKVEIYNDHETLCNCDEFKTHECAMEV